MSELRVRFAPSPTGHLHIGGARTALFNYLLARKEQGTFVLRIEDTDVARSTQESVDAILDAMKWLGFTCDEGPVYQSERFELYREKIDQLVSEGKAYRCYCRQDELDQKREAAQAKGLKPKYDGTCRDRSDHPENTPYVIRFRSPLSGETSFNDRVKGVITFSNDELDDLIIQRTDGTPTYNFVVVVDDATMNITLVLRGDDHINNTPRQIVMYKALGYPVPDFAHVPMILGSDKTRLSKRHGATSVMAYRDMGYLPEALVNYLVRLGWSHGDDEIFSMEELIEKFSLDNIGRSASVFNPDKLLWLNAHYIKTGHSQRLADLLKEYMQAAGIETSKGPNLVAVVKTLQERARTMVEMAEAARFYFADTVEVDPSAAEKFLTADKKPVLGAVIRHLHLLKQADEVSIGKTFDTIMEETGLKLGKIGPSVRVALTGSTSSPGIYEVISVLGIEESCRRLQRIQESL
ncbi:MAG: glutamate--tRNA ligase [Desulfuromonadales bacterium]|nr:glutamate--tRNA ligase [Desulfuromonadales bacterium]